MDDNTASVLHSLIWALAIVGTFWAVAWSLSRDTYTGPCDGDEVDEWADEDVHDELSRVER